MKMKMKKNGSIWYKLQGGRGMGCVEAARQGVGHVAFNGAGGWAGQAACLSVLPQGLLSAFSLQLDVGQKPTPSGDLQLSTLLALSVRRSSPLPPSTPPSPLLSVCLSLSLSVLSVCAF